MEISKPGAFEIVTYTRNGDPYAPKGWVGISMTSLHTGYVWSMSTGFVEEFRVRGIFQ